jgi:hypothetical protein
VFAKLIGLEILTLKSSLRAESMAEQVREYFNNMSAAYQ